MNQRIANKIIKHNPIIILWMYHLISDKHINGHDWLHEFQYKMTIKYAKNIRFKQIRKSKYYSDIKRIKLCTNKYIKD